MSATGRLDRRRFLQAGLGAGAAVALVGLRPWRVLVEAASPPLAERFGTLLQHRSSARAVGGAYLRQPAAEGSADALVEALAARLPGGRDAAEGASHGELGSLVRAAVARDFDEEKVVRLDGWIVSGTEARLCALVARRERIRSRA